MSLPPHAAENFYADIHVHPGLKSFLIREIESPWTDYEQATPEQRVGRTSRRTQSDFSKMFRANVRLVCYNLHLPERYLLSHLLSSPRLYNAVFQMDVRLMREIQSNRPFEMLQRELAHLRKHLQDPETGREAVVARNWSEVATILADPNKICILLCIEGAHCLGFEYDQVDFPANKRIYRLPIQPAELDTAELVEERVQWMVDHDVFMLTLCHIAHNEMGSQATATELTGLMRILPNPIQSLHGAWGNYRGLSYLGALLVRRCYERGILIDIKHCDAVTRQQVYHIARELNRPVIGSHVGFSGRKTNVRGIDLLKDMDSPADRAKAPKLNPWDINLHDDDIVAIHRSGGLLGLIMDERILGSVRAVKEARQTGKWYQLLYNQIEHVYQVLTEAGEAPETALDSLCIGSDFDGFIDPIDSTPTLLEFRRSTDTPTGRFLPLDEGLVEVLGHHRRLFKPSGLEPEQIAQRILRDNVVAFLQRSFRGY